MSIRGRPTREPDARLPSEIRLSGHRKAANRRNARTATLDLKKCSIVGGPSVILNEDNLHLCQHGHLMRREQKGPVVKINVPLPFDHTGRPDEFGTMQAVREIGATVERAGFNAGLVSDHPVPTQRWLDAGGHHAQAPFVMLAMLAASTTTLRLQTGILVLPYRHPFTVARDVTSLDANIARLGFQRQVSRSPGKAGENGVRTR